VAGDRAGSLKPIRVGRVGPKSPPLLGAEAFDPKSIDEIACADGRRKTDSASEEHKENG